MYVYGYMYCWLHAAFGFVCFQDALDDENLINKGL